MWDTTKDYRILVANKARENYLNLIPTASFRGNWNKKLAVLTDAKLNCFDNILEIILIWFRFEFFYGIINICILF